MESNEYAIQAETADTNIPERASCQYCGKLFTGDKAQNQLRGHRMQCVRAKRTKLTEEGRMKNQPATNQPEPTEAGNISPTLTAEERAIADRVATQNTDWFTITEADMEDFSLMSDPMQLPPPAQQAQKERRYAFHWAELKPQRIDQMTKMAIPPNRWALCTRTTTPWLSDYINDAYGCVTKHDCALLFKPWAHHARVMEAKHALNKAYEEGSGIQGRKNKIESRDDDVRVHAGKEYKIGGSDQVLADESAFDGSGEILPEQDVG